MVIVQDTTMQETQLQWSHATNLDITSDPVLGHILDEILDMFPNEYHDGTVGMRPWETTDTLQNSPLNAALKEKQAIARIEQLLMQCEDEFKKTGYSTPFTFPPVTSIYSPVVVLYNEDDDQFDRNESAQWFIKQENQTEGSQPHDYPYVINRQSLPIDHTYAKKRSISDEEDYSALRQLEMVSSSGTISANNSYKRYRTMTSLQEKQPPNNCFYGISTQQMLTTAMDLNKTTNVTSPPQMSGHVSQPSYTSTCATDVRFTSNIKQSSIPLSDILDLEKTDKSQYNFQQRKITINKVKKHQMQSETRLTAPTTSATVLLPITFPAEMVARSANTGYLSSPPPSFYQATKRGMKQTPQLPSPSQSPNYKNGINENLPLIHGRSNMQQIQKHQINQLRVHPRAHYSVSTIPSNKVTAKLNTSLQNMDVALHTKVPETRFSRNYNDVIRESHSNMAASTRQSNQSSVANYQQQVVMATQSFNQQLPGQANYLQANAQNINWQQTQRNQQNSRFDMRLANMVPESRLSRSDDVIRKSHSNMTAYIGQSNLQSSVANYHQQVEVLPTQPFDQQLPSQLDYPETNARNINSQQTQLDLQTAMLNELLTGNHTFRSSGGSYYVQKVLQQQQPKTTQRRPRRVVRSQPQFSPNMQPSYTPLNSIVNESQYLRLQNDAANSTTLTSGGLGSPHSYGSSNFITHSEAPTVHQQPIVHPHNNRCGNRDTYSPCMYNFAEDEIMHPYQALG